MKNVILLFLLTLWGIPQLNAQGCLADGITFTSQQEIDDFPTNYPGCTEIEGPVTIGILFGTNDITNLNGLSQITSMMSIKIQSNNSLEDLTGLNNLVSVGESVAIFNNPILANISALNNLTNIDFLHIRANSTLANLDGLNNLESAIDISLESNNGLTNIEALSNLQTIQGISVHSNSGLTSLAGLSGITSADNIWIFGNPLPNLSGLDNLQEVSYLSISGLIGNSNLAGLGQLTTVSSLIFNSCPGLTSFSGLVNLTNVEEELWIRDNDGLTDIDFPNFQPTTLDQLDISGNDQLTSFSSLQMLTSCNTLDIEDNAVLQNLASLSALTQVNNRLSIVNNPNLTDLSGLNQLEDFGFAFIQNNDLLESLDGFGADYFEADSIFLRNNDLLSVCAEPSICLYLFNDGIVKASNNAPGCNNASEIFDQCLLSTDFTSVIGTVIADLDGNCTDSPGDIGIANLLVQATNDNNDVVTVSTDSLGNYSLAVGAGEWVLDVISPTSFWSACTPGLILTTTATGDTLVNDLLLTPQTDCQFIDWELNSPPLTICQEEIFAVNYCNYGTVPMDSLIFNVELDALLQFESASIPHIINPDGTIFFQVDSVDLFECGQFTFNASVACEGIMLGDVQCITVEVLPDEICDTDANWDGSNIVVNGSCQNDSIHFELKNVGNGNMSLPEQFKVEIVIDDIVLLYDVDQYQLDAGQQQLLSYPVDGWGMRLETQQTLGHPVGEMISMVVPNCSDDAIGNALFTLLPLSDGDPYLETFCAPVVGPFDPNAKSAVPVGLGEIHGIDTDWELHYTLQFQNTGTDTAIQVILRDTLSENLDLSTISVGGSSHAFSWALNPDRELVFTFDDIYLPDSNVNLAASEGFVEFSIFPKADLLPGEQIFNDVAIYFDFNDPVITNTVFHTIRKPVHASSEQAPWCAGDEYDGMVIEQDTSIQIYTDLVTHDSIHFVHLDVLPVSQEMIAMEVNSGATVAGVLITADTSFTQSFPNQYGCDSLINYDISVLTSTNNIELWSRDIEVFPNPVHEVLHIVHHESGQFQEWSLSNNLGVQVWQKQLFPYETLTGVSLFPFPPGIYLLEVKTAEGTASWKILHL